MRNVTFLSVLTDGFFRTTLALDVSQKLKERQKTKGIKLDKKKKPGDDIKISLGPLDAIRCDKTGDAPVARQPGVPAL